MKSSNRHRTPEHHNKKSSRLPLILIIGTGAVVATLQAELKTVARCVVVPSVERVDKAAQYERIVALGDVRIRIAGLTPGKLIRIPLTAGITDIRRDVVAPLRAS